MEKTADQIGSYLSFKLEEELFAINVSKVFEILAFRKITKVPHSPVYMRGVINLRGSVLPVIDTRLRFGMPPVSETVNTCILVLDIAIRDETVMLGIIADTVQEVVEIPFEEIKPAPALGSKFKAEFIQGMWKVGDEFMMILDVDRIFSSDELLIVSHDTEPPVIE